MLNLRQTQRIPQTQPAADEQNQRRWDPTRQQREEQQALIRELGQLQITPGGYAY